MPNVKCQTCIWYENGICTHDSEPRNENDCCEAWLFGFDRYDPQFEKLARTLVASAMS